MKRLLCLLLLLPLLTGCTLSQLAPSSEALTEPSTAPTRPASTPISGGLTVKTDFSAYAPREAVTPLFTRLSEETISALHPSDDYGAICPFIGSSLYYSSPDGYDFIAGELYGIADASGRIVCDPVYSSVYQICDADGVPCLWCLSQGRPSETATQFASTRIAVASLDGSFVTDCIYQDVSVDGNYILCSASDDAGAVRFDLFDKKGNLMLSSEELSFFDRLGGESYSYCIGEGLICIGLKTGEFNGTAERIDYYYMNLDGKLELGPYSMAYAFSDGIACVGVHLFEAEDYYYPDSYAYIDREGKRINDSEYSYASTFDRGYVCATNEDTGYTDLLNTAGEVVLRSDGDGSSFTLCDGGIASNSRDSTLFYDWNLQPYTEEPLPGYWEWVAGSPSVVNCLYSGASDAPLALRDLRTGKEFSLDAQGSGTVTAVPGEDGVPRYYVLNYYLYDDNDVIERYYLLDAELNEVSSGNGYLQCLTDLVTGKHCFLRVEDSVLALYDSKQTELLHLSTGLFYNEVTYLDGLFILRTQSHSLIYNQAGEVVFRYPLASAFSD